MVVSGVVTRAHMADNLAGSSHRFELDLREIREARGVSLSEVQHETRIPVDVLERFEAGHLVSDPNYNEVYLRNLMRAYASAIGLTPGEVVKAYESAKSDTYSGILRRHLGATEVDEPIASPITVEPERLADPTTAIESPEEDVPERDSPETDVDAEAPLKPQKPKRTGATGQVEKPATDQPSAAAAPPAVVALRGAERQRAEPPPVRSEPKARVRSRDTVTSSTSGIESSWGIIIGGTLIALLVIGGALWLMLRPDTPEVEPREPQTVVTDEEEAEEPEELVATDAPRLELPIQVTVIAADGPLGGADGFRVTEEPDSRRPYWIEQGDEQTFSSNSEVIIWGTETGGQYSIPDAARLRLQGYTWSPGGSVLRINQQRGQAILDSLHRAQARPDR
jgi:hypothetical protein